jgi:pimeloyl-ACP methyl ester carboxylesterase
MPEIRLRGGDLDGLVMHHVVEGSGPAVILVHGLGGFAESWRHNIGALARRCTVYAIDLPGFGLSSKPRCQYSLSFFARAIHAFADALDIGRLAIVGHSLGGAVTAAYAAAHPERVDRVALLNPVLPGFGYRVATAYRVLGVRLLGEALAALTPRSAYVAAIARCFARPAPEEVAFLVDHAYAERTGPAGRAAFLGSLRGLRDDFLHIASAHRDAACRLDVPILVIHGRQDPVATVVHATNLVDACPRAAVRWIDACGHFPQIEHAAVVNEWLGEFLATRAAAR